MSSTNTTSNTYTTSTLFSQFVDLYMSVKAVAAADALGWGNNGKSIAWQVANGDIVFQDGAGSWANAYSGKWSSYNADVSWEAACTAIYQGQQRLMYILANPNYPSLTGTDGIASNTKTQADQYALVFRLMFYGDVSSSFDVASYVPDQFVKSYAGYFNTATGSLDSSQSALLAGTYCNSAANLRSQVILQYMGVTDAASSGYRNATWSNYSGTADSNFSHLPTYQALFGNQEYIAVPEFQSVLSPGAYLVDLDKCEQTYVAQPEDQYKSIAFSYRRPDIAVINLADPANTTDLVSQLSIGVNLLALQLYAAQTNNQNPDQQVDVTELAAGSPDVDYATATQNALAGAVYPFSSPFNYNLAKTRSVLDLSNTSLADIWSAYRPASVCGANASYMASVYRDRLGMAAETSNLLTSPATSGDLATVNARYGIAGADDNTADLSKVSQFEFATGLTGTQIESLLYGDLSDDEISGGMVGSTFYINNDGSGSAQMTIDADSQTILNTSATRLDRMNRFIRLANSTGYAFTDLNSILGNMVAAERTAASVDVLGDNQQVPPMEFIGRIKAITDRYGRLGVDACLGLVGLLRNYGQQNGPAFIARVFGSAAPGYNDAGSQNWIPDDTTDSNNLALTFQIMNGLGLSQNDLLTVSAYVAAQFGKTASDSIPLTQDFLSALYRVAISARLFGLSVNDMLFLLDTLSPDYCRYAGPLSGAPQAVDTLMLDAFEAVQTYADMAANAGLGIGEVAFVANSSYQDPQAAPGLNATLTLLTDISQAVSGALLTEAVLASWISGQNAGFPTDTATVGQVYTALCTDGVIDDQGVVLNTAMSADQAAACFGANGISLDTAQLDAFNALLAEYAERQAAAANGVLGHALSLSADVAQTASTWGSLISDASAGVAMTNLLHVLYTLTMDALGGAPIGSLTADQAQTQIACYGSLSRLALLVNTLGLGRQEVEFLVAGEASEVQPPQNGAAFGISPAGTAQAVSLHNLVGNYADSDDNLLTYLSGEGSVDNLATATGWSTDDINTLTGAWNAESPDSIALVTALQACMALSRSTGLAVSSLLSICDYTTTTGNQNFAALASQVEQGLYAANPNADQGSILTTMNIALNESYRDVLVDALLYAFSQSADPVLGGVRNVSALSEYLLFDVEVGGKFVNSVVEEATNAYQTFFYRIIMQLEPKLSFNSAYFTENLWPWFRNYRVWEANREVFVTPENYLEPELRPNPSDIFTSFANNLQSGTLTDSIVQSAFNTYVNDFNGIANLNIVASNFTQNGDTGTIQLIGQTYTSPALYYYRTGTVTIDAATNAYTPTGWTPWSSITTGIPSQFINTIYAFNRLFVFWVEFANAEDADSNPIFQASIKYCFYTLDGGWSTAQVVDTVNVGNLGDISRYTSSQQFNYIQLALGNDPAGIVITYLVEPDGDIGLYETAYYTLSETLSVTTFDSKPTVMLIGQMGGDTNALLTDPDNNCTDPSVAYSANVKTPVGGAGSYHVTKAYQDSPICFTASDFPQLASQSSSMLFSCWIKIADWGSYAHGTNPDDSSDPLAIYLMSKTMSPAGFYLTPTNLGCVFTSDGDNYRHALPQLLDNVPTDTWVYVALSITSALGSLTFNYVVAAQNGNALRILGAGDNNVYSFSGDSQGIDFGGGAKYTFGYTTMGDDELIDDENFHIGNITLGNYALPSAQLARLSGLEHFSGPTGLPFTSLPSDYVSFYVPNSAQQLYILEAGNCQYLALPLAAYRYESNTCQPWRYIRLTSTSAAAAFANAFLTGGAPALLDTSTQLSAETSFSALGPIADYDPNVYATSKTSTATVPRAWWPVDDHIDLGGANSLYYWELFLFAPWLVAKSYHDAGTYDSAESWYQYVFNPSKQRNAVSSVEDAALQSDADASDLYWRFVGLRSYENALLQSERAAASQGEAVEDLMDYPLEYEAGTSGSAFAVSPDISQAMAAYYTDPFNPHAIAMLRPVAYQKAIVMHYVQNLLDWADDLYTRSTRETIVEASLLYMQANDLLGEQPADAGNFSGSSVVTIAAIRKMYGSGEATPEFLLGLEGSLSAIATPVSPTSDMLPYNFVPGLYFGIPQNSQLLAFWSQVASRLGNIRGYLDINGNPLELALFAPALNVMNLVSGGAGGGLPSPLNAGQVAQAPNYRFSALLGLAKEYTGLVVQFGEKLQGILERQDAEALAQLQVNQQSTLLQMMVASKQAAIDAANANLDALKQSMVSALTRYAYYSGLVASNTPATSTKATMLTAPDAANSSFTAASVQTQSDAVTGVSASFNMKTSKLASGNEGVSTGFTIAAGTLMTTGAVEKMVEAPFWLAPNIFGMADGGSRPAAMVRAFGEAAMNNGWTASTWAGMFGTSAGYQRRSADWQLQVQLAEADISQLQAQYNGGLNQLQMAKQDYDLLQTQIAQNQAIADFYVSKFTSEALYQWMAGQMTSIYNQAYRLALSTALAAQYALQYEKGMAVDSPLGIVNTASWNSNYKGLMAGEPLLLSLNQLERYYIDNDARRFEVVKTVSLADLLANDTNYGSLETQLQTTNSKVRFALYESSFDRDYPGQYCRQIKSVSISVPAVLGPYQDLHATLRQTGNAILISPDASTDPSTGGLGYMTAWTGLNASNTAAPATVRTVGGPCQTVAISSGYNDAGLFVLNFDDARYLPFEGTGAVSSWELNINDLDPQLNSNPTLSISDIIVTVRYTALYSASLESSVRAGLSQNTGSVAAA